MKKISLKKPTTIRTTKGTFDLSNNCYELDNQSSFANKYFMNIEFTEKSNFVSQVKHKISSYKKQDRDKDRYNENEFITLDQCVESLVASKLHCHYCKSKLYIFYKNVREPMQWTLDRIDNDLGHYQSNIVISCLDCNLKRRRTNKDKFLFTKQLNLVKKD